MKKILSLLLAITTFVFLLTSCNIRKVKVEFNYNGGGATVIQTIAYNSKVEEPTDPIKEGHQFIGWYLEDELYDFDQLVEKNITLEAKYDADQIKVTFVSDEEVVEEVLVNYGTTNVNYKTPLKDGYTFVGWMFNDELYKFARPIIEDITLVAKYAVNSFIVTFDTNGADTIPAETIEYNGFVAEPEQPTKDGYIFKGWYLEDELYDFATPVTKNVKLVAKWVAELNLDELVGSWSGIEAMMGMEMAKLSLTIKADYTAVATYEMSGYPMPLEINAIKSEDGALVIEYNNGTLKFEYVDGKLVANKGITVGDYGTTELAKANINLEDLVGTWVGNESYSGMEIPYTFIINEDGSINASMDMFGYITEFNCKEVSNKVVFDYYGMNLVFVFDGTNFMGIGSMGAEVVLNKKAAAEEVSLDMVAGTWVGSEEFYGMEFAYKFVINADGTGEAEYESMAMVTVMTVEEYKLVDGKIVLVYNVDGYEYDPLTFELSDGKLVGTSPMGTIIELTKTVSVAEFAGTWTGVELTAYGNYNYTITLNADGTGTGVYVDEAGYYPSDMDIKSLVIDGNIVTLTFESYSMEYEIVFVYQDGQLVSEQGAMWGTLTLAR